MPMGAWVRRDQGPVLLVIDIDCSLGTNLCAGKTRDGQEMCCWIPTSVLTLVRRGAYGTNRYGARGRS